MKKVVELVRATNWFILVLMSTVMWIVACACMGESADTYVKVVCVSNLAVLVIKHGLEFWDDTQREKDRVRRLRAQAEAENAIRILEEETRRQERSRIDRQARRQAEREVEEAFSMLTHSFSEDPRKARKSSTRKPRSKKAKVTKIALLMEPVEPTPSIPPEILDELLKPVDP